MLTHPFFWSENDKFFAYFVENSDFIFTIFETKVDRLENEVFAWGKVTKFFGVLRL